jgi:hypothetical protein
MTLLGSGADTLHLRSVRLRGPTDGLRARQRLEMAMSAVRPSALGLSPQALLLVRRVALAARLRLDPAGRTAPFARAVLSELSRCAGRARRPWLNPEAGHADVVLFADEAELVACLVHDWLRGLVGERWWWRSVLRDLSPQRWLRQHALVRGEVLAPAISLLAERSQAVGWMVRMEDAEAQAGIAAISQAYALSLSAGREEPGTQRRPVRRHRQGGEHERTDPPADVQTAARRRLIAVVPEVTAPDLGPAQRRLLALALCVTRAPSWTRTPQLAVALSAVELPGPAHGVRVHESSSPIRAERRASTEPRETAEVDVPGGREAAVAPADPESRASGSTASPTDRRPRSTPHASGDHARIEAPAVRDDPHAQAVPAVHAPQDVRPAAPIPPGRLADPSPLAQTPPPMRQDTAVPPLPRLSPEQVPELAASPRAHTRFGGIFYLLNVALALKLYGDFTAPRAENLGLSPWDLLALLGRAWFGEELVRDPVWTVLADLAGRRDCDAPGADFLAPLQWAVEDDWLTPWGQVAELRYHATRRRLRLWHPHGFALFDVERDPRRAPGVQARSLCDRRAQLRGARLRRAARIGMAHPQRVALARWTQWLLPCLHARLALALGCREAEPDVPSIVCRHAAAVAWSSSRVDVHLSLATLPLPIRFAGLDRDPGWIPAAGGAVHFHFA